jgi:NitT/TauT family transport system substrate-binding protein
VVVLVTTVALLVGLLGCGIPSGRATDDKQKRIRIADIPLVTQVPIYVALDRGYFRDEGLEVDLVPTNLTPDAVAMLATSQVELAAFGPDPAVFNAMDQGIGMKMLASATGCEPAMSCSRRLPTWTWSLLSPMVPSMPPGRLSR